MRLIESKPKYEELYRDIYHALKWLIFEHRSVLKTLPRVPDIIYSRDEFLESAYSFIILQKPDRTFNSFEYFENEDTWYEDCMKKFQDEQCFDFDSIEDMKNILSRTREKGIYINGKHDSMIYRQ